MTKILVVLLSIMLITAVVFTSFGIAYSTNDFVGTFLTVEHGLGKLSTVCLSVYDKFAEFVSAGGDLFGSIYDATFGKFIVWIEEKFDFSFIDLINHAVRSVSNFFRSASLVVDYMGKYGVSFFDVNANKEFSVFMSCIQSSVFYDDFEHRLDFDWNKFEKYKNAFLYGEENEFSYMINYQLSKGIFNYVSKAPASTVFIGFQIIPSIEIDADNYTYYFTTVDLDIPDDYCPFLTGVSRLDHYYNDELPVYDTNITYTYHDYECELVSFRLRSPILDGTDGTVSYNGTVGYYIRLENVQYAFDLIFRYFGPGGKPYTFSMPFKKFIEEKKDDFTIWNTPNVAYAYDGVYVP